MLLFDTETVSIGGKNIIWEFAGIDTNSLQIFHYFHGENIRLALNTRCNNGMMMFFSRYQLKHASKFPWLERSDFFEAVGNCLGKYKTLTAYNIGFDAGIISNLGFLLDDYKLLDLWGTFVKIVACKRKYILWCNDNNYLTKTKIPKTDAETAYRYLSGYQDFKTPHLAVEDIKHELTIYNHLKKQKKANHYGYFGYNNLKKYFIT